MILVGFWDFPGCEKYKSRRDGLQGDADEPLAKCYKISVQFGRLWFSLDIYFRRTFDFCLGRDFFFFLSDNSLGSYQHELASKLL